MEDGPTRQVETTESHGSDTILTTPQDPHRLAWVEQLAQESIRENAAVIAGLNQ